MDNFKSNAKGKHLEIAKKAYIELIDLLKANDHKLLSEYINNKTKVLIDFNCEHEPHWITPDNYKNGKRCPKCAGKCPEQAKEELIELLKANNHKLLSEYINNKTKVLINFNCGHKPNWIRPNNYKNGNRCPLCKNKGEATMRKLIKDKANEITN